MVHCHNLDERSLDPRAYPSFLGRFSFAVAARSSGKYNKSHGVSYTGPMRGLLSIRQSYGITSVVNRSK